jgi:hypothetical protein
MIRKYLPKSTEELIRWYERYVAPFALIAGFLLDTFFFLDRVDSFSGNLYLFSYLVIAAVGIVAINIVETGYITGPWVLKIAPFLSVVVQFAFGGLLSGYLSLYSRSASVAVSWIFVIAVALLMIGNERFRRLYVRFTFQIAIFFTTVFSFLIFFLPVVLHRIGPMIFMFSGATSLVLISLFLLLLKRIAPEIVKRDKTKAARAIAAIFLVFNVLYFTNLIPPLPLSLKEAGVYHRVTRVGTEYHLLAEPVPWYERYLNYNTTFHRTVGEDTYVYSAIFAPTGLSTIVLHQWQRFDTEIGSWVTTDTVRFTISGGRDGGYRGYSIKSGLTQGKWRVNVLTQYGQTIGRIAFTVVSADTAPELREVVR